jgi:hypothetical protein
MDTWYIDSWQHLMGALDSVLDDARGNAATIPDAHGAIDALLSRAEQQRSAAEAALRELAARRRELAAILDEMQRELAVAGVPLRGEIS